MSEPMVFFPDPRYKTKNYIGVVLLVLLTISSWAIPTGIAIGVEAGDSGWIIGLGVALLTSVLALLIGCYFVPVYYRSLRYEIHDDEIIVMVGVITKSVKHVPFRTVTNIEVKRGPLDRLFGIGTLAIQTAGFSGTSTSAEETLVGLENVQEVYEKVAGELRRFRAGMFPTQTGEEGSRAGVASAVQSAAGETTLTAILDELRAIRSRLEQS